MRSSLFLAWVPAVLVAGALALQGWMQAQGGVVGLDALHEHRRWLRHVFSWQQGLVLSMLGVGAGIQTAERPQDAIDFFVARGIAPGSYLMARWAAVATWVASVVWLPMALLVMLMAGLAPAGQVASELAALAPVTAGCLVLAAVVAAGTVAVGLRIEHRSRAMLLWWLVVFLPPAMLALLHSALRWPSLKQLALPAALTGVVDALFFGQADAMQLTVSWLVLLTFVALAAGLSWWLLLRQGRRR